MLHIVTGKFFDFDQIAHDSAAGRAPGHVLINLAQRFPSQFHMPTNSLTSKRLDHMRSRLFSRPNLWALARQVVAQAKPNDIIYATGEDIGLPLAHACSHVPYPPKLAITVHNLNRPRARLTLRLFHSKRNIHLWLTPAPSQADFLQHQLHIPPTVIKVIPEQTDTHFYRPSPKTPDLGPLTPTLASVGLEQRDYRTLSMATHDLPVNVRISGFSRDAAALRQAFPEPLPKNMSRQFYEWSELLSLYQQADLVVVPLFENRYLAGITTFLEALACKRPVIVTRTQGLAPYTDIPNICLPVPPNNPAALRTAIQHLLENPAAAQTLAQNGYDWLQKSHTPTHWLDAISAALDDVQCTHSLS